MFLLAALFACSDPAPPQGPTAVPSSPELKAHMQAHLADVTAVWTSLGAGDLAAAKQRNQAFLEHKVAFELPRDWLPRVARMGEPAGALRSTSDLRSASWEAAALSAACGECHDEAGIELRLPATPATDGHAGLGAHLDGLQLALISPSHSWKDAAKALDGAAASDPHLSEATRALLGGAAKASPAARASVAGAILAECGTCHAAR